MTNTSGRRLIALFTFAALNVVLFLCAPDAKAQTVQLPTFHFFSVNTTVSVPDGGDVLLGGIGRSASGRSERGIPGMPIRPFDNVATGRTTGASNISVSAQIHDFDAMERALLGSDIVSTAPVRPPLATAPAAQLAVKIGSAPVAGSAPVGSVAALKAQVAVEDAAREKDAAASLARGRQLLAEGKTSLAKTYCQIAARNSTAEVRQQALATLQEIERSKAATKIAGQ